MWQNAKYYAVAYVVVVLGALISTGFRLLETSFPEIHPLNKLAAILSGISLGTVIMVVGLIRDKRVDDVRKETNNERQRADKAEAAVAKANHQAELARHQAEQAREQAERDVCGSERPKPNWPGSAPSTSTRCSPASAGWRNSPACERPTLRSNDARLIRCLPESRL